MICYANSPSSLQNVNQIENLASKMNYQRSIMFVAWVFMAAFFCKASEHELPTTSLPGLARPVQTLAVRSPIASKVHTIHVSEGSVVEQGSPLIQMDDRQAQAKFAVIELRSRQAGRMLQAQADVDNASKNLARLHNVQRKHELAQNEIELAENALQKSIAALRIVQEDQAQIELQLEVEKLHLAEYKISAPFSGTVTRISTNRGEIVSQEQELLTLVDYSRLLVDLQIPIHNLSCYEVGKSYQLRALAPLDCELPATLHSIDPVLDSGTGTTRCCFCIENGNLSLPAGFLVILQN